jgi:hypothetical protein
MPSLVVNLSVGVRVKQNKIMEELSCCIHCQEDNQSISLAFLPQVQERLQNVRDFVISEPTRPVHIKQGESELCSLRTGLSGYD